MVVLLIINATLFRAPFIPYVPSSREISRFQQLEADWFEQGRVKSNVFQNVGIPGSVKENPQFLTILKKLI